ncbi:winged helix-turn-helix transcriptional regulator [Mucilaginibacter gynuensis]|uniref:winged helix-turn-helix transcriptional regulator n=1 Tax=Mucilaginibacter gynuensis TaxID=1302236 RepID=UPI003CD0AEB1
MEDQSDLVYSYGIKRPGELQRKIHKASRRLLGNQLKQLSGQGIIHKVIYDSSN